MAALQSFRRAQEAEYRHGNRKGCLEGTRRAVLDEIEVWTRDPNRPPVYWLNGLAGTGKSTIAQTIAERVFADGRLGGSFFCSRDSTDRSNLRLIFPTLAVQLARKYPKFRLSLIPLVRTDPECAAESLDSQMRRMIVGPLKESAISTVIVIDALDECRDEDPESGILSVIGQFTSEIPNVKFFLTGRPEPHILQGFGLPKMVEARDVFVLHEVEPSEIGGDLRRFFTHWFLDIARRRRGLDDWPTTKQLNQLCERAGGLFVYAMATVKFIDSHSPRERLDLLLQSPESSAREGKAKLGTNTTLDSLYTSILQQAFGDEDPEEDPRVRSALGAVVLTSNPLSPSSIATILSFNTEAVFSRLSSIHSLLILQEDVNLPVLPFHKSFPDFITDPIRCINKRFHISPPDHHLELLVGCLNLMGQRLEENMCGLPDAVTNDEVYDLDEKAHLSINKGLKYACESWHKHLIDEHMACTPKVTSALHHFLEKKFLCWLEVLSVLGSAREAVDALGAAAKLLEVCQVTYFSCFPNLPRLFQESPTLDLVYDCFQFVTGFFKVIHTSAPHIYHSALHLSPQTSIIHQLYQLCARPLTRIVHGLPTSWDPSIMVNWDINSCITWSPCSKFIAVDSYVRNGPEVTIEILDGATLQRLSILRLPQRDFVEQIFSPDSRLLTVSSTGPTQDELTTWDLQTGIQLSAIHPEVERSLHYLFSFTYSECGTMVGTAHWNAKESIISIYNVLSGTHLYSHEGGDILGRGIWTHGGCIRYATFASRAIIIWEFGFASRHEPTQVKSLSTPDNFNPPVGVLILPSLSRLSFCDPGGVMVWDVQESRFLLNFDGGERSGGISFSHDGHLFACGPIDQEIFLWKDSPTGYVLHRRFIVNDASSTYQLISPDGGSVIAGMGSSLLQVWRTMDPTTSLSDNVTRPPPPIEYQLVEFSPDGVCVAITRFENSVVTVLDLKSGDPWLVIDTGMEVRALGVGRGTIIVVDQGKIVTWDLPMREHGFNARVNIDNSAQITTYTQPKSQLLDFPSISFTTISTNLDRMAIMSTSPVSNLFLYNMHTGQCLASTFIQFTRQAWFTPGGHEVWFYKNKGTVEGWSIIEDNESDTIKLECIGVTTDPPGGLPWESSYGYQVTDDGWVLNPSGKRLLWLPPHSRPHATHLVWSGQFLALLDSQQPGPVILELPME
jgi:WD40 repeat protein